MFNIGGEYICRNHLNKIEPILPLADIIVGNSEDVKSLAEELKWPESRLDEIALRLSTVGENEGTYKTVIITQVRIKLIFLKLYESDTAIKFSG